MECLWETQVRYDVIGKSVMVYQGQVSFTQLHMHNNQRLFPYDLMGINEGIQYYNGD